MTLGEPCHKFNLGPPSSLYGQDLIYSQGPPVPVGVDSGYHCNGFNL